MPRNYATDPQPCSLSSESWSPQICQPVGLLILQWCSEPGSSLYL